MGLLRRDIEHANARVKVGASLPHVVRIEGVVSDPDVATWLKSFVEEIHGEAVRARLREVMVDITQLEYASAAMWKCFILWLKMLREDDAARYNLRIHCDPQRRWQQVGTSMLRAFAGERLVVD